MASDHVKRNDILVDKRFLAINFDELNLLQSCMLLPKTVNILALKKRLGIKLTKQDLIQDMQDKHSPIHKFFQALILSEIARILWSQEEGARQALARVEKKQKEQAVELLSEEMDLAELRAHLMSQSQSPIATSAALPPNILININEAKALRYFILEKSKIMDLEYYSRFAKDKKTLAAIHQLVESRYEMIEENFNTIEKLYELASTPEELAEVQEYDEKYLRHLELSSHENIEKNVGLDLDDRVVLEQHLEKQKVIEELEKKSMEHLINKITPFDHLGDSGKEGLHKNIEGKEYHSIVDEAKNWAYVIFLNTFNDLLTKFLNKNVITKGYKEILELQTALRTLINTKDQCVLDEITRQVFNLKNLLSEDDVQRYNDIINHLNSWQVSAQPALCKKTIIDSIQKEEITNNELSKVDLKNKYILNDSDKEIYESIIEKIKQFSKDLNISKDFKILLENLYNELEKAYTSGKLELVISSYNKLVEAGSNLEQTFIIYNELISLSFVDPEKLKEPTSFNYGLLHS